MRTAITAVTGATAALVAAGALGVASAEAPTPTPARTVSVEGVAIVPIAQSANLAAADAVYRQAMGDSMADAQNKAEFLTSKAGAALGAVQSIVEGGGYISCSGGSQTEGSEYLGAQPDFGTASGPVSQFRVSSGAAVPLPAQRTHSSPPKRSRRHRGPAARKASAATCTLSTQVALVYAIT